MPKPYKNQESLNQADCLLILRITINVSTCHHSDFTDKIEFFIKCHNCKSIPTCWTNQLLNTLPRLFHLQLSAPLSLYQPLRPRERRRGRHKVKGERKLSLCLSRFCEISFLLMYTFREITIPLDSWRDYQTHIKIKRK